MTILIFRYILVRYRKGGTWLKARFAMFFFLFKSRYNTAYTGDFRYLLRRAYIFRQRVRFVFPIMSALCTYRWLFIRVGVIKTFQRFKKCSLQSVRRLIIYFYVRCIRRDQSSFVRRLTTTFRYCSYILRYEGFHVINGNSSFLIRLPSSFIRD